MKNKNSGLDNAKNTLRTWSVLIICMVALGLSACRAKSTKLQGPAQSFSPTEQEGVEIVEIPPTELDAVIVVDNSKSMEPHQNSVRKGISKLLAPILKNSLIDLHAGVLPIYDKESFENLGVENQVNALGILHPLKDPAQNGAPVDGPRFVTRDTPRMEDLLGATINMGVHAGPRFEEVFSPVMSLMADKRNAPENAGFLRGQNAHLAVFFVTDAEDGTEGVTDGQFYKFLVDQKGGDPSKVSVFALIIPSSRGASKNTKSCRRDFADLAPGKIENVASWSGGLVRDLCNPNFEESLTEIGDLLASNVGTQTILLRNAPDENEDVIIDVFFNVTKLDPEKGDFYYDRSAKSVTINGNIALLPEDGRKPRIKFTPVNFANAGTNKLEKR